MKELQRVILEGIIVLATGAGVALLANAVSPKRLSLTRNYFPTRSHANVNPGTQPATHNNGSSSSTKTGIGRSDPGDPSSTDSAQNGPAPNADNPIDPSRNDPSDHTGDAAFTEQELATVAQIEAEGLQAISHPDVVTLFNDPGRQLGDIIFIDARNEKQFQEAHIPGAVHMDHFFINNVIDEVLPLCQSALQIVVYCGGGDCEDSLYAAIELRDRGIDPSKICVYIGGMKQWKAENQPVESGAGDK